MEQNRLKISGLLLHYARNVREKYERMRGTNSGTVSSAIKPEILTEKNNFFIGTMIVSFVCAGIVLYLIFTKRKNSAVVVNRRARPLSSIGRRRKKKNYISSNRVTNDANVDDPQFVCTRIVNVVIDVMDGANSGAESDAENNFVKDSDINENDDVQIYVEKDKLDVQDETQIKAKTISKNCAINDFGSDVEFVTKLDGLPTSEVYAQHTNQYDGLYESEVCNAQEDEHTEAQLDKQHTVESDELTKSLMEEQEKAETQTQIQEQIKSSNVEQITPQNVEQITTPNVEQITTPNVEQITTPNVEQITTPNVEQITTPNVEQITTPNVEQIKTTNVEQIKTPNVEQIKTPNVEQIKTQNIEQINTQNVEQINTQNIEQINTQNVEQITTQSIEHFKTIREAQFKAITEAHIKAQIETQIKMQFEEQIKEQVEAQIKAQAEAQIKAQAEAQIKAQAEAQIKAQAEAKLKAEGNTQIKAEAEMQVKTKAEPQFEDLEIAPIQNQREVKIKKCIMGGHEKCTKEMHTKGLTKSHTFFPKKPQNKFLINTFNNIPVEEPTKSHRQLHKAMKKAYDKTLMDAHKVITRENQVEEKSNDLSEDTTNNLMGQQNTVLIESYKKAVPVKARTDPDKTLANEHKNTLTKTSYNTLTKGCNKALTQPHKITVERQIKSQVEPRNTVLTELPVYDQSSAHSRSHSRAYSRTHSNAHFNVYLNAQSNANSMAYINSQRTTQTNAQRNIQSNAQRKTHISAQQNNQGNVQRNLQFTTQTKAQRNAKLNAMKSNMVLQTGNVHSNIPTDLALGNENRTNKTKQNGNKSDELNDRNIDQIVTDKSNTKTEIDGYTSDDLKQLEDIKKEMVEEAVELRKKQAAAQISNKDVNHKNNNSSKIPLKNVANNVIKHVKTQDAQCSKISMPTIDSLQCGDCLDENKEQVSPRKFVKSRIPIPTGRRHAFNDSLIGAERRATSVTPYFAIDADGRRHLLQRSFTAYSLKSDSNKKNLQKISTPNETVKYIPPRGCLSAANKSQQRIN